MQKSKRSKKKKLLIMLAVILAVLVIAAAACVYFIGTDNLKSVYYGIKYDDKEIVNLQEKSSERLKKELDKYDGIEAREPTAEETKAVESGEISEDQLVDIISGGITLDEYRNNNYSVTPGRCHRFSARRIPNIRRAVQSPRLRQNISEWGRLSKRSATGMSAPL